MCCALLSLYTLYVYAFFDVIYTTFTIMYSVHSMSFALKCLEDRHDQERSFNVLSGICIVLYADPSALHNDEKEPVQSIPEISFADE